MRAEEATETSNNYITNGVEHVLGVIYSQIKTKATFGYKQQSGCVLSQHYSAITQKLIEDGYTIEDVCENNDQISFIIKWE